MLQRVYRRPMGQGPVFHTWCKVCKAGAEKLRRVYGITKL